MPVKSDDSHAMTLMPYPSHNGVSVFKSAAFALLFFSTVLVATAAGPFLRPESTVVLVSGLPGDLESESSYKEQLHAWLQILETVRPKQIIALADEPESIGPADGEMTPLTASRSNFLAAASLISGSANPLVVIIWGHGGKQGNSPVFHVRGPRITPSDLSTFVEKAGGGESQWVLCFRGSGLFASQLSGNSRQILSSESDTIFNSDPIEMTSMLKVLRENPAIDFDAFAKNVGRATAEWYKERNLARTEEPTLWIGHEKPQLLAAISEHKSVASPQTSPKITNDTPKDVTSIVAKDTSTAELPDDWKDLKRVDLQDFPESDAVLLRRRISYTLAANPAVVAEHDEFIQILTAEGKRFGDFDISYAAPSEDINFSDCEVLSPQGKLTRLNPDAIREVHQESPPDYQGAHRKFFSLPGVVPGAILHVRYRNEWKKFPLPHVSMEIPISSQLEVVDSTLQVSVPKEDSFHFALENVSGSSAAGNSPIHADPVVKQTSYGATYTWQFTNLAAETREILGPPKQGIALLVSTFPDWSDFADWYGRVSRLADEITPEIKAKAAELTQHAKSDREKILSVYNYVTGLRYVAIPLGINSFRPHAAANVFKNQFGDCKDKANLFNAMLHSLNIDANLVLVPRFRQAYDDLPGLAFNHAISRVTLPGQTLWVDTTDDLCRFGMLPPGDSGRNVLVIASGTNSLTRLPMPEANRHKLTVRGKIDCSRDTNEAAATFDVVACGYPDYELRESAREVKEHAGSLPVLSTRYRLSTGALALENQISTGVASLDKNFSWRAEGSCIGICRPITTKSNVQHSICAPLWLPKEWDLALHLRHSPLFLNQGYPVVLDETAEIMLPLNGNLSLLPDGAENKENPLRWKVEWARNGNSSVSVNFRAELPSGELNSADSSAFREQLRALVEALNVALVF